MTSLSFVQCGIELKLKINKKLIDPHAPQVLKNLNFRIKLVYIQPTYTTKGW